MSKSKSKTYTTTELARHFNISVVSASRFIVKHNFMPVKTGNHNSKYYSDVVFQEMKKHYQNNSKSRVKPKHLATKDDIIKQLRTQIKEQAAFIELLKHQLDVKDEQLATANKIADQAQQLDLTTHNLQKIPEKNIPNTNSEPKHGWLWKLTH